MAEVLEGEIRAHREDDGRVVIDQAPPVARASLEFIRESDHATVRVQGNTLTLAGQVRYRVTGWDPHGSCLLLERDDTWQQAGPPLFPPGAGTKGA